MLKDNLAMLRNIHGFSQEELAEKINISRQAYAKWERGDTIPDVEKCSRLAEIFGVSIDSLIKTEKTEGIGMIPPAPKGKNIWGSVAINERGQIVIPKAARDQFALASGHRHDRQAPADRLPRLLPGKGLPDVQYQAQPVHAD